jgi:hypothetical protein
VHVATVGGNEWWIFAAMGMLLPVLQVGILLYIAVQVGRIARR